MTEVVQQYVTKKYEDTVVKDGVAYKVVKTVTEAVPVTVWHKKDLGKATFGTAAGKKLTKAEAEKRLAGAAPLIVSGDGKPVDAGFLAMFKGDTLVIVLPPAPPAVVPNAVPVPLPPGRKPKDD